jgi:GNAT superfamily N-acetyltransferase
VGTTVRRATERDADRIAAVHVRSWQVAYRGLLPDELLDRLSVEQRKQMWSERLAPQDEASFTLVAEADGVIAGFCSVALPSRDDDAGRYTGELAAIYVQPRRWRAGIGGALLAAMLEALSRRGWSEVTLWVFASNHAARAFYERFGFEPDGAKVRDEATGLTEIRLRAQLTGVVAGG